MTNQIQQARPTKRRRPLHLLVSLSPCLLVFLLGPASTCAQEKASPEFKATFHLNLRRADANNPNVRIIGEAVRWDADGARILLTAGKREARNPGIATSFKISGDFEITGAYEIVKADTPTEGYGVGVTLYAAIDPDGNDAVSLARRVNTKGETRFSSNRMRPDQGKTVNFVRVKESKATAGKLRIRRVGSKVRFYVADGDNAEFVAIEQFSKEMEDAKKIEVEFGAGEIRHIQFGGNAGNSSSGMELRLLELTVRADDLPGLIPVAADAAAPGNRARKSRRGEAG